MTCDDGKGRSRRPVGHGDTGIGRGADGRRDAWDDFKGQARVVERQAFFAAAAEDEGVAAFETDDNLAFFGFGNEQVDDFILGQGVVGRFFADIYFFRCWRSKF